MLKCKNCGKVVERPSHFSPVEGLKIKFKFEDEFKRCLEYIENNKITLEKQVVNL